MAKKLNWTLQTAPYFRSTSKIIFLESQIPGAAACDRWSSGGPQHQCNFGEQFPKYRSAGKVVRRTNRCGGIRLNRTDGFATSAAAGRISSNSCLKVHALESTHG